MRILIVSGIWPPDLGGPASHGPELGGFLAKRGHEVEAVTSAGEQEPEPAPFPVTAVRRDRPLPLWYAQAESAIASALRGKDVVYSTGLYTRSAVASRLRSVPLVMKLASDPAFERARRHVFEGDLEAFQSPQRRPSTGYLKWQRSAAVRHAAEVVIPSRYLAQVAIEWGIDPERVSVVPNPAPELGPLAPREELRRRLGIERPTFVFAGRFATPKNLPLAVAALSHAPGADLVLIGDGPEAGAVARAVESSPDGDRVSILGAMPRESVLDWVRAADGALLSSDWENFPHSAVEALAVGTPVIATAVGGVPEIVETGVNGTLVAPGDERGLGEAMAAVAADDALARRLREGALETSARYAPEAIYTRIEALLERAAATSAPAG